MPKNSEVASEMNQAAILDLLRDKGPLSKADMTRMLGISFPAVSYNVKKLMNDNMIYEVGEADNAIGRKATLLAFNSQKAYLVGIDLGRRNIRIMCSDVVGNIIEYKTTQIAEGNVFQQVIDNIYSIISVSGITISDVICIGVGIPGIYDKTDDKHKLAPFAEGWGEKSLYTCLKEEFSVEICMENSVNLGAIGERWKGVANGYEDIVYVDFGVGFGSALIMNGELIRGKNGAFGEIGYMVLGKDSLTTTFNEEGALERLIPSKKIEKIIQQLSGLQPDISIKSMLEAIEKNDPAIRAQDVIAYFAMSLINTVVITNPDILVISGRLGCGIYKEYQTYIDAMICGNAPFPPKVQVTKLAERASVIGAIAIAMLHSNNNYHDLRQFN